jgi:uncharacterized membrane protein YhaH (DUF805 family)
MDSGRHNSRRFWWRWVGANALAEMIGLGVAGIVGVQVFAGEPASLGQALVGVAPAVLAGAFEGLVVGWAQWSVLRRRLPDLRARSWIGATVLGALVAWCLGMLPSTLMSLTPQPAAAAPSGPSVFEGPLVYPLAMGMGAVLGLILGLPQWGVLRRWTPRGWRWIAANSAAWALGMPIIFLVAGGLPPGLPVAVIIVLVLATLAAAGAVVGAVHGAVLVRMLPRP